MKIFVALFVSMFAVGAFACPDINATFQCEKDEETPGDTGVEKIERVQESGAYAYKMTDMDTNEEGLMPADGKTYNTDDGGKYTGSCTQSAFVVNYEGTDAEYGPYTVDMDYTLDSAGNLQTNGVVKIMGGEHKFNQTCTRL